MRTVRAVPRACFSGLRWLVVLLVAGTAGGVEGFDVLAFDGDGEAMNWPAAVKASWRTALIFAGAAVLCVGTYESLEHFGAWPIGIVFVVLFFLIQYERAKEETPKPGAGT